MSQVAAVDLCRPGEILKNRWEIRAKLGAGGFGQIYFAKDYLMNNIQVAVKIEASARREKAQLPMELYIMKRFQGSPHAITLYGAGTHEQLNYIVMELIGPNLAKLRRLMKEPTAFTLATTIRLGIQCVESIRDFQMLGAIHRDIKPSNFAMGPQQGANKNRVYILDFGLARIQTDLAGNILPQRNNGSFQGTLRYCSLAAHYPKDLGRKDDMISFFYMTIEFLKGCLPWRDMNVSHDVIRCKEKYNLERLCVDFPDQLRHFALHINGLGYADRPHYDDLLTLFQSIIKQYEIDMNAVWDWENKNLLKNAVSGTSRSNN